MGWNQKAQSGGGNFDLCPAGNHPAVLIGLIDLGTQTEKFQGQEERSVRKVFLTWEIPGEKTESGRSHVIGREYTLSFHEKAALRQLIESWRGKSFAEGEEFDISKLLDQACMLTVLNEDSNKRTFAKIKNVAAMPKGMAKPKATLPTISFNLEDNHPSEFPEVDWLPWSFGSQLVDIAKQSPEWKDRMNGSVGHKPLANAPSQDADEAPF